MKNQKQDKKQRNEEEKKVAEEMFKQSRLYFVG